MPGGEWEVEAAEVVILPDASHYDEVAATSPAWPQVLRLIEGALGLNP